MDMSLQEIPSQSVKDAFFDIASIVAVVLIGLVVLVLMNPRIGTDLGTVWLHQNAQSHAAAHGTAAR
jgi:preprotein translocase subunit SecG